MSALTIYLLMLKATVTSFAGMGSLPQVRQDFVVTRQAISDEQLSQGVTELSFPVTQLAVYLLLAAVAGMLAAWLPARRARGTRTCTPDATAVHCSRSPERRRSRTATARLGPEIRTATDTRM